MVATSSTAVVYLPTLTQAGAAIALQAAALHATDAGVPMSIAIVDAHTQLLAFSRMDAAKLSSIETSIAMAVTSAANRLPTSALAEHNNDNNDDDNENENNNRTPNTSIPLLHHHLPNTHTCTLPGGLPILSPTGALLGAIGCSTGTSLQGEQAAAAGRDAVLALIQREADDEERRIGDERAEVLRLWREKEAEVVALREELEFERGGREAGKRRKMSAVVGGLGVGVGADAAPDTPPEEAGMGDFLAPSFVGEVRVGAY